MTTSTFLTNSKVYGGTEFAAKIFHDEVLPNAPKFLNYNCLLFPGKFDKMYSSLLRDKKEIILWLQVVTDRTDGESNGSIIFKNTDFVKKIKYVVAVSDFHKQTILASSNIPEEKIKVIYNPITEVENSLSRFENLDTIKMIHTSDGDRGFDVLSRSLKYIDYDFVLKVFNDINPNIDNVSDFFSNIYQQNKNRLFFYGKTPKETVIKELSESHLFLYPCTVEETFCISLVEAISANCVPVYNNIGALPEVSFNSGEKYYFEPHYNYFEEYFNFDKMESVENHAILFADKVNKAIEKIKNKQYQLEEKSKIVNEKFSKKVFIQSWFNLHEKL